jgi:L-lactate dehydrogenase complex protein LldG
MQTSSAKKNILKKIKQALAKPVPLPFEVSPQTDFFVNDKTELELQFAENFSALQGRFSFCISEKEMAEQLQILFNTRKWNKVFTNEKPVAEMLKQYEVQTTNTNLSECDAAVTTCEYLIARSGSIVVSSLQNGRTPGVYAPVHICVAYTNQLVFDIDDSIKLLQQKYGSNLPSVISFTSGPSRTSDIEKTLVTGVHGPKELFCFLVQA